MSNLTLLGLLPCAECGKTFRQSEMFASPLRPALLFCEDCFADWDELEAHEDPLDFLREDV